MMLKAVQFFALLAVIHAAPSETKFGARSVPIGILASTTSGLMTQTLPDNVTTTVSVPTVETEGVAYNKNLNKVYYVLNRYTSAMVYVIRSNIDGTDKEFVFELSDFFGDIFALAIDQNTNNVYYSIQNNIVMCDKDVNNCQFIVSSGALVRDCWGLAVNPSEGAIYWTNRGPLQNIMKAGLDGSNPRVIVSGLDQPGDIIVDGNRLLWSHTPNSTIHTSDLNGENHRVFLTLPEGNDVVGLAADEDTLYFANWGQGTVQSCNKANGSDLKDLSSKISARFVDVYSP